MPLPNDDDDDDFLIAVGTVRLDCDEDIFGVGGMTVVSVDLGLFDFDDDVDFIEGVSNDSLAFGSSSFVYRPIEGLLITWRKLINELIVVI